MMNKHDFRQVFLPIERSCKIFFVQISHIEIDHYDVYFCPEVMVRVTYFNIQ